MTCSRCSRRPGASASTFTTAAAWRRFQPASATGLKPTVVANRPSSVTGISGIRVPAADGPSGPLARREQQVLPLHHGALAAAGAEVVAAGHVRELGIECG